MRRNHFLPAVLLFAALSVFGCDCGGPGDMGLCDPARPGEAGGGCCIDGNSCNDGARCVGTECLACGAADQRCCNDPDGERQFCNAGLACNNPMSGEETCMACGGPGQPCCGDLIAASCHSGSACIEGRCQPAEAACPRPEAGAAPFIVGLMDENRCATRTLEVSTLESSAFDCAETMLRPGERIYRRLNPEVRTAVACVIRDEDGAVEIPVEAYDTLGLSSCACQGDVVHCDLTWDQCSP